MGEQQVGKQWAGRELETAVGSAPDIGAGKIGRQQVRRELHAAEIGFDARSKFLHGSRLRQTGRAFDQQVTIGQQRHRSEQRSRRNLARHHHDGQRNHEPCPALVAGVLGTEEHVIVGPLVDRMRVHGWSSVVLRIHSEYRPGGRKFYLIGEVKPTSIARPRRFR